MMSGTSMTFTCGRVIQASRAADDERSLEGRQRASAQRNALAQF
jgi:hypothetical protein